MGSIENIPHDCFSGDTLAWLGIRIGEDPELEPRTRLITVPYAYHALRADTADYVSGAASPNGWVDDGAIVRLVEETDTVLIGPGNSGAAVNISVGTNLLDLHSTGLAVETYNESELGTTAGYFYADADVGPAKGVQAFGASSGSDTVYALNGRAKNYGSGPAIGVFGETDFVGTGDNIGVRGRGCGAGAGNTYGGYFSTAGGTSNTGFKYGVYAYGYNLAASNAYGVYGEAYNANSGAVIGGYFTTSGNGTGSRFGVASSAFANNSSDAYGINSISSNDGSGDATAGFFFAQPNGTGDKRAVHAHVISDGNETGYGVDIETFNNGSGISYGIYSETESTAGGEIYGGHFDVTSSSTVKSTGLVVDATCSATGSINGIISDATNTSTGNAIGGNFTATGTGNVFGVVGTANGDWATFSRGVWGWAENLGVGDAEAGYFAVSTSGIGTHYGVFAYETAGGSGAAVYAAGDFVATGTKTAAVRTSEGITLMYAMESTEVLFEDFGNGQMKNGVAHIELDPLFLETVTIDHGHPMRVFIQLNDDCNGTYVKTSLTGFDVYELQQGTSGASFTYRVVAKRKGYEDERMRVAEIGKNDPHLHPERADEILEKMKSGKRED